MKRYLAIVGLLSFLALPLRAETERTMSISASPIALIFGNLDLLYQVKLTNYLALTIPGHIAYSWAAPKVVDWVLEEKSQQTLAPIRAGGGIGARFLLANRGLNNSFYLEPRVTINYEQFGLKNTFGEFDTRKLSLTPMARLGYDWYFDSGFYMSLGAGLGFNYFLQNKTTPPTSKADQTLIKYLFPEKDRRINFALDLEFKLGFAW